MSIETWLSQEIAEEKRIENLVAMDGGIYNGDRKRTLEEVQERLRAVPTQVNPDYRADHDSLFARFEQLDGLLSTLAERMRGLRTAEYVRDAHALVGLIRKQVLK